MAVIKYLRKLVPELNFWINRNLYNNTFNKDFLFCPTKISEFWRSNDSVIELIFNETADPSGATYDDGYHFIWKYRTINLKRLPTVEPLLFKRIQVYYNSTWVYAAKDDPKFSDIFNLNSSEISGSTDNSGYPYNITPSKYVNYTSHIVTSGSDQLHYDEPAIEFDTGCDNEAIVYREAENVFGLTEEELNMCEYLYYYRIGDYEKINLSLDMYNTLQSPLSKWVLVYLICYLYDTYDYRYLKTITTKEDESFRCLVEKHLQNRVYEYIQKHSMVLWENILKNEENEEKRTFKNYTLRCNIILIKSRFDNDQINNRKITIEDRNLEPNNVNDFEFIFDGILLKQGEDFSIENIGTFMEPKILIKILNYNLNISEGKKYQFMYGYVETTNPITGFKDIDSE